MRTIKLNDRSRKHILRRAMKQWCDSNTELDLSAVSYRLAKRVLHESYGNSFDTMFDLLSKDPIRGKFVNLDSKLRVFNEERNRVVELDWHASAQPLLPMPNMKSINTVAELVDGWPGVGPYIDQFMLNPTLF